MHNRRLGELAASYRSNSKLILCVWRLTSVNQLINLIYWVNILLRFLKRRCLFLLNFDSSEESLWIFYQIVVYSFCECQITKRLIFIKGRPTFLRTTLSSVPAFHSSCFDHLKFLNWIKWVLLGPGAISQGHSSVVKFRCGFNELTVDILAHFLKVRKTILKRGNPKKWILFIISRICHHRVLKVYRFLFFLQICKVSLKIVLHRICV